jgi:hypothetical protein
MDASNYNVTANTAGAVSPASFSLQNQYSPILTPSDAGGTYNGNPFPPTATAVGVDGTTPVAGSFSYTYYSGIGTSPGSSLGSTAPINAGTYTVVANFTSNDPDYASGSAETIFTISPAAPTLTVSDGDTYNGNPFPANATAVGIDGTTPVPGSFTFAYYVGTSASGTPSATAPTNAGTYTVVATFTSNDPNYASGTAQTIFTISPAAPTLTVSDGGTYNGNPFPANATAVGIDGTTPVPGSFTFAYYVGSSASGTPSATAPTNAGTYTVLASFTSGDSNYSNGTAQTTFTISPAATTTSNVSLSSSTAVYGQPVTVTATVSNTQTAVTPSGTVGFYDGSTELVAVPVEAGGIATLTFYSLSLGKHTITASFSDPAGNFTASSSLSAASLTIGKASTTTTLTDTTSTPVYGQSVTFTATVAPDAPSTATPTGTVTFKDGSTVLATVSLSGGSALFTTSKLALGSKHAITAYYNGTSNFGTSQNSPADPVSVSQDGANAVVTSSVPKPVYGQSVTLTAKVTASAPGSGTPTGTVTFYDGTTSLGTATLSNGVASIKTTALLVGANSLTVVYGGDSNFLGTTSPALTLTVKDSTRTGLTSSSPTAAHGTQVTFTAAVLPVAPGSGTPTGTVSFWDGSTLLGTVNLSNGTAQLMYVFTLPGSYKIKAVYSGDPDFLSSTSSVLTETIT